MRYEDQIKEAELMASSPEAVATYLRQQSEQPSEDWFESERSIEKALLGRRHPLIDLALARYCRHPSTARDLFAREHQSPPLRLAVLANRAIGRDVSSDYPCDIFTIDQVEDNETWRIRLDDELRNFLATASDDELEALFENPIIGDFFLRDFLSGDKGWEVMCEQKRLTAIRALARNERVRSPYQGNPSNDIAEGCYYAGLSAAWRLAETAPATYEWAGVLCPLFGQLLPVSGSLEDPLGTAARWQLSSADFSQQNSESAVDLTLTNDQEVRKGLAKLALSKSPSLAQMLLDT